MKRIIIPLLGLLFLGLASSTWIIRAASEPEVRRLTEGAALWALEAWIDESHLLAVRLEEARIEVLVNAEDSTVSPSQLWQERKSSRIRVSVSGTTHRLFLDDDLLWETDEEILGRPVLSADGAWLVLSRTPRGNETTNWGELWRIEVKSRQWLQLTDNQLPESSPVISPDGTQVAFLRQGDIWLIPANKTTREALPQSAIPNRQSAIPTGFDHVPPETIRVIHVAAKNNCRPTVPDGRIDQIPFEEYVKRVVPHESPPSWHLEALKAQSVAARTYAWRYVLSPADPSGNYDVTDTTDHQYMCDEMDSRSNEAVDATIGQHLTYNGQLIAALFSAENSSPTKQNAYGHLYLSAVDDPVSFGTQRRGHGQGYSQWGGKRWADLGWRYGEILLHYYTDAQLEAPAGDTQSLLEAANRPVASYQRGSAILVKLNGNHIAATRARQWWLLSNGWQFSDWQEDQEGSNGWRHLFSFAELPELQQNNYRIEYGSLTQTGEQPSSLEAGHLMAPNGIPVLYLGIDRTPPNLIVTLNSNQSVAYGQTANLNLTFQSSDNLSGIERIGWSQPRWQQEAEDINHTLPIITDSSASGGAALRLDPNQISSPQSVTFEQLQLEAEHYRLWFRLRASPNLEEELLATLRLFDEASTPLQRGVRYLRAGDFPPPQGEASWTWFFVDVDMTTNYAKCPTEENPEQGCQLLTALIEWHGSQTLEIDQLVIATRPQTLVNQATITITAPEPITLYGNDQAGNVTLAHCEAHLEGSRSHITSANHQREGSQLFLPLIARTSSDINPIPTATATITATPTITATATPNVSPTATPSQSYRYECHNE